MFRYSGDVDVSTNYSPNTSKRAMEMMAHDIEELKKDLKKAKRQNHITELKMEKLNNALVLARDDGLLNQNSHKKLNVLSVIMFVRLLLLIFFIY